MLIREGSLPPLWRLVLAHAATVTEKAVLGGTEVLCVSFNSARYGRGAMKTWCVPTFGDIESLRKKEASIALLTFPCITASSCYFASGFSHLSHTLTHSQTGVFYFGSNAVLWASVKPSVLAKKVYTI